MMSVRPSERNAGPRAAGAESGFEPKPAGTVGAAIGRAAGAVQPENLPVRDGEDPWTADELAEVLAELESELGRLADQIEISETDLVGLLRDTNESAGRDEADVGAAHFERDYEISLADNARALRDQTRLALQHLASDAYGLCDSCGRPIGKGRLQAFPMATSCMECKRRQERR
jgi:DnaK suppressor protein